MLKLKLEHIKKTYRNGETVIALKGVSLGFRESEFVSILGPSGCGKTTLLNVIGGLDHYDSGDLVIAGTSTTAYKDSDWDAYRNRSIGFVFQSYNLIGHQTVLQNVEIALTLSGVSKSERKERAMQALSEVGLSDQMKKKPNQLSGGQMQRVAVARALVNNPDIILADEPTGALDSHTSIHLMEILKEIAKTRLVIMVTHNGELAAQYSSRIINLLDGEIQSDSHPCTDLEEQKQERVQQQKFRKTSMSLATATGLSFKNLLTKRGRSILTAAAGSIGIIGVALVLALSSGLSDYMTQLQRESLAGLAITIDESPQTVSNGGPDGFGENPLISRSDETGKYTDENVLYNYDSQENRIVHTNNLTDDYFDYIAKIQETLPEEVTVVSYTRAVEMNLLAKGDATVVKFETTSQNSGEFRGGLGGDSLYWQEMDDNEALILSLYDLIGEGSRMPQEKNEIMLVVDAYNRLDKAFFEKLGIYGDVSQYELTDFIGQSVLKVISNDAYYSQTEEGLFASAPVSDYDDLFNNGEGLELVITGVLRLKENTASLTSYLSTGLVYTTALTDYIVDLAQDSEIAQAQMEAEVDVLLNTPFFSEEDKRMRLLEFGADTTPTGISIYPTDYVGKEAITAYLDDYNVGKAVEDQIVYTDMAQMIEVLFVSLLNTVTYVLIAFAAISLVVSTVMIAIIIYVSVIERTKEIGILRSVGARKKDISRLFNAEALLIGLVAGLMGVVTTYILQIPVNGIILNLVGVENIAALPIPYAIGLVLGSMGLTLLAGYIPSKMAAKKDPVVALRTE